MSLVLPNHLVGGAVLPTLGENMVALALRGLICRDHRTRVGRFGAVMGRLTKGVALSHWVDFHGVFLAVHWCLAESALHWFHVLKSGSDHLSVTSRAIVFPLSNFSRRPELWSD